MNLNKLLQIITKLHWSNKDNKIWLNYRIQGKFSRYMRWGGSVAR